MDRAKKGYSFWAKVGFTVYVIVCLIIFIYIQFPYDMLKDRLEQTLSRVFTADVSLGHMSAHFPLGLAADSLDINGVPVATKLTFHPEFTPLFFGRFGIDIFAQLSAGTLDGFVETPVKGMGKTVELVLDAQDVDPAAFSELLPAHIQPKGIISGHAVLAGPPDSIDKAQGTIAVVWKDGSIPLSVPALPIDALGFKSFEIDARMEKGMLTIDRAELNGDISGTVKGAIRVRELFERSRLNLTGEVLLPEGMKSLFGLKNDDASGGLKFSLRGTLGSPRFRILSR